MRHTWAVAELGEAERPWQLLVGVEAPGVDPDARNALDGWEATPHHVSQYSAATPDRLDWFKDYNKRKAYAQKVKPFDFLPEFYAKRFDEMVRDDLLLSAAKLNQQSKPIAPYSCDPYAMLPKIRDRVSGEPVEQKWLRTYAETLRGYHRHPETKFLHADATDSGPTQRRHRR